MSARRPGAACRRAPVCNGLFAAARAHAGAALAAARAGCAGGGCDLRRHASFRHYLPVPAPRCGRCMRPGASPRMRAPARRGTRSRTTSCNSTACACRASARGQARCSATRPATRTAACSSSAVYGPAVHLRAEGGRRRRARGRPGPGDPRSSRARGQCIRRAAPAAPDRLRSRSRLGKSASGVARRRGRAERPALGAGQDALLFLGRFDEVILEGHDSSRTERNRLRQVGFTEIELVDTSERGRPLLRAQAPASSLPLQVLPSTASR